MSFGERLKYVRIKNGLTQDELAKKVNKSRSTIAGYEINDRYPDFETIQNLALVLNASTDFLLIGRELVGQNELGEYIKKLRIGKNITLEELASETGFYVEILEKIENGEFQASPKHIKLISLALKVPYSELMAKTNFLDDKDVDVSDLLIENISEKQKLFDDFYNLMIETGVIQPGEQFTEEKKEGLFSIIKLAVKIAKIGIIN